MKMPSSAPLWGLVLVFLCGSLLAFFGDFVREGICETSPPETPLHCLREWQTLITGILALIAAAIAAYPVWKQLGRMETQANVALREILVQRIRDEERFRDVATKKVSDVTMQMMRDMGYEEEDLTVAKNPHWAFNYDQSLSSAHHDFQVFRASYRDAQAVENAKDEFAIALKQLIDSLSDIHWPAHNSQYDEDHSFSDEQWAEIEKRAEVAPSELSGRLSALFKSERVLDGAYAAEIDVLRGKLRKLDDALF